MFSDRNPSSTRGSRTLKQVALSLLGLAFLGIAACGETPKPKPQLDAPAGNWISLFNGSSLDGWIPKIAGHAAGENYGNTFRVEDGLLKVSYDQYGRFANQFGSLFYSKPFSKYWLRVEYRFVGSLVSGAPRWAYKNSGLQLHCQSPDSMHKDQQFPVNVEFDLIGGWYLGSRPTGNVCQSGTRVLIGGQRIQGQCSKLSDITIRDSQWTTALAEVEGGARVRQAINGAEVVEYTDIQLDDSNVDAQHLIAQGADKNLTSGYISLQSNGHPVEFRRIEVLPIQN